VGSLGDSNHLLQSPRKPDALAFHPSTNVPAADASGDGETTVKSEYLDQADVGAAQMAEQWNSQQAPQAHSHDNAALGAAQPGGEWDGGGAGGGECACGACCESHCSAIWSAPTSA